MSEYSDNLYEIEWAVYGPEIIGDLYKLTETGPVMTFVLSAAPKKRLVKSLPKDIEVFVTNAPAPV